MESAFRGYAAIVVGILMLVIWVIIPMSGRSSLRRAGEPVTGTITFIPRAMAPAFHPSSMIVVYFIDDERFNQRIREVPPRSREGREILLFYDPLDPSSITTGRMTLNERTMLFFGTVTVIGGLEMIIKAKRKEREKWDYYN